MEIVHCRDCKHWASGEYKPDQTSPEGECQLAYRADSQLMEASEYLLTSAEFGCVCGETKPTTDFVPPRKIAEY